MAAVTRMKPRARWGEAAEDVGGARSASVQAGAFTGTGDRLLPAWAIGLAEAVGARPCPDDEPRR